MEISGPWYVHSNSLENGNDHAHYVLSFMSNNNQLNTGQTGGPAGRDINVVPAWMQGFTGKGVVVSVVDDGEAVSLIAS